MHAVYLLPRSSYVTHLRSDTLWGLIIVALRNVYSDEMATEIVQEAISGTPRFIVSSAMLYEETKEERLHYFPRPILKPDLRESTTLEQLRRFKKFKKIRQLPQSLWEDLICGRIGQVELYEKLARKNKFDNKVQMKENRLHVAIDRLTNTTLKQSDRGQLFYTEEYYISRNRGGLFFLVDGEISLIEPALRFLQHYGFGGDVSIGKGVFDVEIKNDFQIETPDNPTHFTTLSLYLPTESELKTFSAQQSQVWYELEVREGRIANHFIGGNGFRKPPVTVFCEGSTFPILSRTRLGRAISLQKIDHIDITYSGFAFSIPACWKEDA